MAWGNKKNREFEYRETGQATALKAGDLGVKDIYFNDETDFQESWELEPDLTDNELEPELEIGTLID